MSVHEDPLFWLQPDDDQDELIELTPPEESILAQMMAHGLVIISQQVCRARPEDN